MRYSLSFVIEKDIRDEFPFIGLGRTLTDIEDGGGKGDALDRVMTDEERVR